MEFVAPGIWKIRIGSPEKITPWGLKEEPAQLASLDAMTKVADCPIDASTVVGKRIARGTVVEIPMIDRGLGEPGEQFYGLGLQLKSFKQTGLKKTLRVNSDPIADTGDSHAPVPFFVSTAGYGIYVDTARYATFYLGSHARRQESPTELGSDNKKIGTSTEELYGQRKLQNRSIMIDVPGVDGVDIYVFAGPTIKEAVQRYNLLGGGGCLPPMWGLGVWYRAHGQSNQEQIRKIADYFRGNKIPCDVLGFEPGWQTAAYSCSYVWSRDRFAQAEELVADLRNQGFEINLWEHVFIHPTAPIHAACQKGAGDIEVWGGLVPDFLVPQTRAAFADYHRNEFVARGIGGFKLDECDNSDFIRSPWSFPELTEFPSGVDGEQMHTLLGMEYQRTLYGAFKAEGKRTYSEVRSSGAWASPYPFVLYSDLYDHRDFIRGLVNAGFSGLLWTPEVRDARSPEELRRRLQTAVFSPQALVNAWYIQNPPWMQVDKEKNNAGEFFANVTELEAEVRELFHWRMRLVPYLYSAFARYYREGIPPFRALVLDYPEDASVYDIDDQYLMGDDLLVAPLFTGQQEREVYLPAQAGGWYDLFTHEHFAGSQKVVMKTGNRIAVLVKAGSILPLAEPVEFVGTNREWTITPHIFGRQTVRSTRLWDDRGEGYGYQQDEMVSLILQGDQTSHWETHAPATSTHYRIGKWEVIG